MAAARARLTAVRRPSWYAVASAVTLLFVLLEFTNAGGRWLLYEDVACVLAPLLASVAVWGAAGTGNPESYGIRRSLAISMALTALGQFLRAVPDVVPSTATAMGAVSDVAYVAGAVSGMSALMRTLFTRLQRDDKHGLLLDGLIVMFTSMAMVVAFWQGNGDLDAVGGTETFSASMTALAIMVVAASFFASAGAAALVALALRVRPRLGGVWAVLVGIVLVAIAWTGWLARFLSGGADSIEGMDLLFPVGALLLGHGGRTWSLRPARTPLYDRFADMATEWLPLVAVLGVGAGDIIVEREVTRLSPVGLMAWLVVLTAMARQRFTRSRERSYSERLTREVQERAATSVSLARLEAAETPEATADRVCLEALRLDGVDSACVFGFETEAVVPLAVHGLAGFPVDVGEALPPLHAERLRQHADFGLWIEQWAGHAPGDDLDRCMLETGISAEALVPLYWNDEPFGLVAMGTKADSERLTERLAAVTEFSVVAAAILGPMVAERRLTNDVRREIRGIIETNAFHPVFQPFVALEGGQTVGFEALTRFDDGRRPDLRFADAQAAGLAVELECAAIRRQVADAEKLPEGTWVSLNVSPALAEQPDLLFELLAPTDRDVVLEITEHVEVSDYPRLLAALEAVRRRCRLAVDDAGAGYAGLRHILELKPEFVKLDISVVRSVDTDPARQAMVAGMAHFAANAGCELIAEGIETDGELATLKRFGVSTGQGYLLGRPARLD